MLSSGYSLAAVDKSGKIVGVRAGDVVESNDRVGRWVHAEYKGLFTLISTDSIAYECHQWP